MIKGIVCVDKNWGIGKQGGLLFKLKEDMENFKRETINKIVVMGENTLLSLPGKKPLKHRTNIVLCPDEHEYEGCICVHKFSQLVNWVQFLSETCDVYIIGGGMMYNSMLPYYDEVLVTKVKSVDKEATVFFPNLDMDNRFEIVNESEDIDDNNYSIKFVLYKRQWEAEDDRN